MDIKKGYFYFLSNQYFVDFPDPHLMKNKETIGGVSHDRPCFYAFPDENVPGVVWLVPFSSKVDKYRVHYERKMSRYKKCNTIRFGEVLGEEKAFLIQNMCPATSKYLTLYRNRLEIPIQVDERLAKDVYENAKETYGMYKRGNRSLIFPNVTTILEKLQEETLLPEATPSPAAPAPVADLFLEAAPSPAAPASKATIKESLTNAKETADSMNSRVDHITKKGPSR